MKLPLLVALFAAVGYSAAPQNMMAAIPLHFEPNVGQTDPRVSFTARGGGMSIFLTPDETVLARQGAAPVQMKLRGGKRAKFEAVDKLPGVSNYYRGNDRKKWREGVPHYARVRAKSVYEGIDLVYYGNGRRLEYDFVVAPGADASKIELAFEGAESMRVDKGGDLVLVTQAGELRQRKPVVYQEVDGRRVEVAAEYRIRGRSVRFEMARHDAAKAVVIDPILEFGTLIGGSDSDRVDAIAVDNSGIWVAGHTLSLDFPRVNATDLAMEGWEAFIAKFDLSGATLAVSALLGGSGADYVTALALDSMGNVYAAGDTYSTDFPVLNPAQARHGGTHTNWFVTRLTSGGALASSTYLGGDGVDQCHAIAVTPSGIFAAGAANSTNFLGLVGSQGRAAVVRLSLNGSTVVTARTLPGATRFWSMSSDPSGAIYLTGVTLPNTSVATSAAVFQPESGGGEDAFVAKLSPTADQWLYATNLAGTGKDAGMAVAVDSSGQAYVAGETASPNFPVKNAFDSTHGGGPACCLEDAFLTVINPSGTGLVYSTLLGGSDSEAVRGVAVTLSGVVVTGHTSSNDFPLAAAWDWEKEEMRGPEAFVAKFSSTGALLYSSFFGTTGGDGTGYAYISDVATGPGDAVYLGGFFQPPLPPQGVTPSAYDSTANGAIDGFLAKLAGGPAPVSVTVTSNPAGRTVLVDGQRVVTPATLSWLPGTQHTLDAISQQAAGQTVFTFASWAHGGAESQTVTAPATASAYTVNYSGTTSAAQCVFGLSPGGVALDMGGGSGYIRVTAPSTCRWTPTSGSSWLRLGPIGEFNGSADFQFGADANPGPPRSTTISIGSAVFTATQRGGQVNLTAPILTSPAANQQVLTKVVTASWSPVTAAAEYEIRIHEPPTGLRTHEKLVYAGRQTGTSASIDLPPGWYVLYVRGCLPGGHGDAHCGSYGTVSFRSLPAGAFGAPQIVSPTEGQVLRTSTNQFSWNPMSGATSYDVTLVDQARNRTELQITTPTASTIFTMRSSSHYLLKVRGCAARCSDQLSVVRFSVVLDPVPQTPPAGLAAQLTSGNTLNLSWNPVLGADLYRVQVVQPNAGPGGGALTVAARQVSTTSASLQVPAGAATVVLNACNGDGCGPPSTIAVNPSGPNPSTPVVGSPMPVVVANGPNITISWSRIPGDNGSNTDYRLYVGDLSRDGPALDVITKDNFYGAFLRAEGRRYDALVFATQNGNTVVGPASGFMVAGSSATAPLITSPTHNSTFKQGPFRLAWSPIPDAVRYQYYVGRQGQSGPVLTGVTPGIFVDTSLSVAAPALHQAIVRACPTANANQCTPDSDAGWGPWSQNVTGTTSFTIAP